MTYIVSEITNGKPGNCILGIGVDIISCKATGELCIVHKDDKHGQRAKKSKNYLICPFNIHTKVVFEYEKKESE